MVLVTAALLFHCAKALRRLRWTRLPVYATPVVVGEQLRGYALCGMQLSTPQFRAVLHKPHIGIVPDPFLVKAVWLRETTREVCAVLIHSYSRFGVPITVTGVRGVWCGVCCGQARSKLY